MMRASERIRSATLIRSMGTTTTAWHFVNSSPKSRAIVRSMPCTSTRGNSQTSPSGDSGEGLFVFGPSARSTVKFWGGSPGAGRTRYAIRGHRRHTIKQRGLGPGNVSAGKSWSGVARVNQQVEQQAIMSLDRWHVTDLNKRHTQRPLAICKVWLRKRPPSRTDERNTNAVCLVDLHYQLNVVHALKVVPDRRVSKRSSIG